MTNSNKPPVSFWIIAVLALLWNIMGVISYLTLQLLSGEAVSEAPEEAQAVIESLPTWVTSAYAIAVWFGLLGSILLLAKKKWAKNVFLISLAGIVIQDIYVFFISNTYADNGAGALVLPVAVLIIGIYLYSYSGKAITKGWIR